MGGWYYIIRPGGNGLAGWWVAFAKRTPFVSDGDMNEPGDFLFEFARTETEVAEKILSATRAMRAEA